MNAGVEARLPLRLDAAARARCLLILADDWKAAVMSTPEWEDQILHAIAPGNAGREKRQP